MGNKKDKIDATFGEWLGEEIGEMPRFQLVQALDKLYLEGPDNQETEAALTNLQGRMEEELPALIFYADFFHEKLGRVWIAQKGNSIIAIDYAESEEEFLDFLRKLIEGRYIHSESALQKSLEEVSDYLASRSQSFTSLPDLSTISEFQRMVLEETRRIPRGQISSYGEIAKRIGKPKASRAVGQALRRNPIPILVPCHRVLPSDGTLGGYDGKMGDERKAHLLKLEGVVFA